LSCALPRGARQRVLPFPCVLSGARQRGCDAVSPRTAVNTFSLPCITYYAQQRTVSCVAFSQSAQQSSLSGKNESGALCCALWKNAHGKGGAVRFPPFVVRRRRAAKSAIPVVPTTSRLHPHVEHLCRRRSSSWFPAAAPPPAGHGAESRVRGSASPRRRELDSARGRVARRPWRRFRVGRRPSLPLQRHAAAPSLPPSQSASSVGEETAYVALARPAVGAALLSPHAGAMATELRLRTSPALTWEGSSSVSSSGGDPRRHALIFGLLAGEDAREIDSAGRCRGLSSSTVLELLVGEGSQSWMLTSSRATSVRHRAASSRRRAAAHPCSRRRCGEVAGVDLSRAPSRRVGSAERRGGGSARER
jgi:hypothetical protein